MKRSPTFPILRIFTTLVLPLGHFAQERSEYPDYGWVLIISIGFLISLICFIFAIKSKKKQRFIRNIPTSKTTGVFIGLVEVKGKAESKNPLTSFLSEKPCVYYTYKVEEHWTRQRIEPHRDKQGNAKTRVKTESGWEKVSGQTAFSQFYVRDDYGVLRIDPNKADIKGTRSFRKVVGKDDPLYYAKGPAFGVNGSDGRRRFTEEIIELHKEAYVIGNARERKDKVEPEIAFDKSAPLFVVSSWTEKRVGRDFAFNVWALTILGLLFSIGGWVVKDLGYDIPLKEDLQSFLIITAAYFGLWILGWIFLVYNDVIRLRNFVRQGWSNVDVQLARRHDLISDLVLVVKGFKKHEKVIQEMLALLRSQSKLKGAGSGEVRPQRLGRRLYALREAYPELKAESVFLKLQEQLSDTETRVALARSYYNDIATNYNTRLQSIPDGLIAKLAFLKPVSLIEAEDFERPAVEIELTP